MNTKVAWRWSEMWQFATRTPTPDIERAQGVSAEVAVVYQNVRLFEIALVSAAYSRPARGVVEKFAVCYLVVLGNECRAVFFFGLLVAYSVESKRLSAAPERAFVDFHAVAVRALNRRIAGDGEFYVADFDVACVPHGYYGGWRQRKVKGVALFRRGVEQGIENEVFAVNIVFADAVELLDEVERLIAAHFQVGLVDIEQRPLRRGVRAHPVGMRVGERNRPRRGVDS